ncbi:NAD(P)-dependent oxidoreductase [Candidatus Sodalis sp. SoCistrobi]|uniref:NAD(P)-dependent oxidoreductase n=1 Tax=Candidatus Sodalis sp. SoCistrobi TaxID=1922216 RepID=UPI000B10EBE2|nr:NAD(P)-dependent oxidoreductase [Candidatus Sodalis sp. SoCistrobi]
MEKYCLILQPIHACGIERLRAHGITPLVGAQACRDAPADQVVAAIYRSGQFSRTEMAQLPFLCAIGVHGVGVDGIDVDAADALGIAVFNTPEMNTRSVAEHALALMFALTKRIPAADSALRAGHFAFKYEGGLRELQGAVLGVVGFGAIGRTTAALARGLGMHVKVLTRRPAADLAALGFTKADSLPALLAHSDIVSLHLPSLPETRHIIDAQALAQMKTSAYLY